jgi:alkylation response protein AidB-like acyl-CoA dehydrogenase
LNEKRTPAATQSAADALETLLPLLAAAEREHDRNGVTAVDNLRLLADSGLLAVNTPREFGGLGESLGGTVETIRKLAQASPSTALMFAMHTSTLSHYRIAPEHIPEREREGFVSQRAWAFGEAVNGKLFAVANSEAGAGGDVKSSRAEVRDGRLTGSKTFCSMGTNAHYYMAAARDETGTVEYWLVANDPERVQVEKPWNAVGMRSSESVSLRFEDAPVIGALAYRGLLDGPNHRHWATLSFTALFVGAAESLLDLLRGGTGILHATTAVDLHLALQACRSFVRHCVAIEPPVANGEYRRLVRDCKLYVTRTLAQHAAAAYSAQGGSAYRFDSPLARTLRDLLAGPALRPPVGVAFDEVWEEISGDIRQKAKGKREK